MTTQAIEARDRTAWQVIGSYGIGAWIALQVADTLSSLIGLPLWFGQVLLVVLVIGFVVLVATGLVQRARSGDQPAGGIASLFTWRNSLRAGIGVLGVMAVITGGYLAMRAIGIGPVGTLQARGVLEAQDRLVLADFEGNVSDPALRETATTLLRIDLAQSQAFTVLEPAQLSPVLARMQRDPDAPLDYDGALEVARREGIKAIVTGDLLEAGAAIVVSARIVVASTGEAIVAVRETANDPGSLPDAIDAVSAKLRERIGESLRAIQGDPPLEEVTTASLEALEKYAQSDRANNAGDDDRAIALMREALEADSLFAMGHRKLGILLVNRYGSSDESRAAFRRAYELRDRLTDRERWLAEAAYLSYVEEDSDASMDRYVTLLESYPTDPIALNNLAIDYNGLGRAEEAAELYLRSIEAGGAPSSTFAGVIPVLYGLGREAEARDVLAEFERTYPDNRDVANSGVQLRSAVFEYDEAEAAARVLLQEARNTPGEPAALLGVAQTLLVQGEIESAWELFAEGLDAFEEGGSPAGITPGAAEVIVGALVRAHYRDDPDAAVAFADEARRRLNTDADPPELRPDLQFAMMYAFAGRADRAREMIAAHEEANGEGGGRWLLAQGTVALAEGRADEAIALIHQSRVESPGCPLCGLHELGRVFDESAQPDSAIHYLEEYFATRDLRRLNNSDNLVFWHAAPRLAELHEEHGDPERARELYQLFLNATADADPEYQAKRERVAARMELLAR